MSPLVRLSCRKSNKLCFPEFYYATPQPILLLYHGLITADGAILLQILLVQYQYKMYIVDNLDEKTEEAKREKDRVDAGKFSLCALLNHRRNQCGFPVYIGSKRANFFRFFSSLNIKFSKLHI